MFFFILESFEKSSITYKPSPSILTGSVWINAKRAFNYTSLQMESRWNHSNKMVLDDTNIIDNQVSDPDVNNIKICLTLLPHRNNTNKFHLENVDCSSVQASVICRVDPLPTTTTTTTTTTTEPSSSSTSEVLKETLPALPCITPLRRRKRQPNANEEPNNSSRGKFL